MSPQTRQPETEGLILFAHGARDPRWAEPFASVAARVAQQRHGTMVKLAFLELMAPTLPEAADELVAAGCRRIVVLPLFLGTGGHVRRDLPVLMQQLEQQHPQVRFVLQPAVGEAESVIDAMAGVALTALDLSAITS